MGIFDSGASGAAAGSAFGPVGIGVGLVGGILSGILGESSRKKRFKEYLDQLEKTRRDELGRTVDLVGNQVAGTLQNARAAGSRRAAAEGRLGAVESIIAPIEAQAQSVGSRAIRTAIAGVENKFDSLKANAYSKFEDRPLQPNAGDWIQTIGEGLTQYGTGQDQINQAAEASRVGAEDRFVNNITPNAPPPSSSIQLAVPEPVDITTTPSSQTIGESIVGKRRLLYG